MITATEQHNLTAFLAGTYVPSRLEISAGAIEQISIAIRLFERWAGKRLAVWDLSEDLLRRFLTDYRRGHSPASTNSKRRHLLGLWQCAFEEEILDRPPRRARIRKAKEPPPIPGAFTIKEVGRLFRVAAALTGQIGGIRSCDWWSSILRVCFDSGERRGALLATESADLDLDGASIVFRHTKTGRERWCPLHSETVDACQRIHDSSRPLVWPWPWHRRTVDRWCTRILARAEVRRRRKGLFQTLRVTSGTLVEAAGGDGSRHIGNTRAVFERHYLDPRFMGNQLGLLPRPR